MPRRSRFGQCGPASKYTPTLWAAFVRRQGEYGILWPGAVYDGEAARTMYAAKVTETAAKLGAQLNLRPEPIYSLAEADAWIAQAQAAKADGLVLVMLDRQQHAWPTAQEGGPEQDSRRLSTRRWGLPSRRIRSTWPRRPAAWSTRPTISARRPTA